MPESKEIKQFLIERLKETQPDYEEILFRNMLLSELWGEFAEEERTEYLTLNMLEIKSELEKRISGKAALEINFLTDTAYSILYANRPSGAYTRFQNTFHILFGNTVDRYLDLLEGKKDLVFIEYSMRYGLCGALNYMFEFLEQFQNMIRRGIILLQEKTREIDYVPVLDLGMESGIGAWLAVLLKAYSKYPGKEILESIEILYQIFCRNKIEEDGTVYWPGIIRKGEIALSNTIDTLSYGATMILWNLRKAEFVLQGEGAFSSLQCLKRNSRRDIRELILLNPTFYNGYSGIMSLFDSISKNRNGFECSEIVKVLLNKIDSFWDSGKQCFAIYQYKYENGRIHKERLEGGEYIRENYLICLAVHSVLKDTSGIFERALLGEG